MTPKSNQKRQVPPDQDSTGEVTDANRGLRIY